MMTLHAYQRRAVEHLIEHPCAALFLSMGLGKSVITLTALARLLGTFEVSKVLIVAPLRVVEHTWPAEHEKWSHVRHLRIATIRGNAARRRERLRSPAEIHTINYDLLPWLVGELGKHWPYDCVVFDESSRMKASRTKRFRALRKVRAAVDRVILLTGTPAANGLLDLWAQAWLLDGGQRLGRSMTAYKDRWFESDYMGYTWTPREGAEEQIHARLSDLCLSMRAEDYLELPSRVDNVVPVTLPAKAMSAYRELEREMLIELGDETVTAVSAAALSNKCLQAANGTLYVDGGGWSALHDAKLDALEQVIEEAAGWPVLVGYAYRSDVERIRGRFKRAVHVDERGAIERWNRGEVPLLLAHPQSAGHGLNLQAGGHIVAWFGLSWSLEHYQQFNARLHRQGQQRPVFVHHLVAEGTLDERVMNVLAGKATVQDALLGALREAA